MEAQPKGAAFQRGISISYYKNKNPLDGVNVKPQFF